MNIKDVAEKSGFSITTVSRVLNNPEAVSKKTREKILKVMEELNYTPNWFARNLQTSKANVIAMMIPDTLEQSNMEITQGVENIARQNKYSIILCNTEYDRNIELEYIDTLVQRKIDGLILVSSTLNSDDISKLKLHKTPFLFIGKTDHNENETIVYTNYDTATEEAIDHLAELGRKKIAVILSEHPESINAEKLKGYKTSIEKRGLKYDPSYIRKSKNTIEGGYVSTSKLLAKEDRPDAIFASTDTIAFGVIERMKQDDLTPKDLAVIGYDDLDVGTVIEPKLTTITKPSYRMGLTAARLLFDIIEDKSLLDSPQAIMIKSRLKIRKSCGNEKRLKEIW